ncbi:hypothetical protein T265_00128 [Opisthorchis viverrini]|uniref:Uncharacterized protein n=1 Tax=Opisthorchis viverrini TaxID=6198 RepID=A0A075ADK5_OPIVI|nr:hypothetical protein T265_00128 [Opisthorchis viverrini]KER34280.1 hypothetical protein T265_00128 [Opisthorchis viverrini]
MSKKLSLTILKIDQAILESTAEFEDASEITVGPVNSFYIGNKKDYRKAAAIHPLATLLIYCG